MQQNTQKFVEKIDFITTPGYLHGPNDRERVGLPLGTGPYRVVTQLGVMTFDEKTKRMSLLSIHPGVTIDQVKANTGFKLIIPEKMPYTEPPSQKEIEILRTEIDPLGIVLGSRLLTASPR